MGRHSGRATPSLDNGPYRQFDDATGRRSTYPLPIPVQKNRATSVACRAGRNLRTNALHLLQGGEARLTKVLHLLCESDECAVKWGRAHDLACFAAQAGSDAGAYFPDSEITIGAAARWPIRSQILCHNRKKW